MNLDDVELQSTFHDNLLQDYSDSSDSGISSKCKAFKVLLSPP